MDLTEGTVAAEGTVPTVPDNMLAQGLISSEVVGVFFAPTTTESVTNGELTFGGFDSTLNTSSVSFAPLTTTSPASEFWGIDQSITFGNSSTSILETTAGIVDTGTTLVMLATDAFDTYVSLTGATEDETTGLLSISAADYANLPSLFFNTAGTSFELTKNAQVRYECETAREEAKSNSTLDLAACVEYRHRRRR